MATVFNRASHLRIRIRQCEARALLAAEQGNEYGFEKYSALLERLESWLAAELAEK